MDDKRNESLCFLCAALDACGEKAGVWYKFRCPIYGGRAWVSKSTYNFERKEWTRWIRSVCFRPSRAWETG